MMVHSGVGLACRLELRLRDEWRLSLICVGLLMLLMNIVWWRIGLIIVPP